MNSRLPLYIQLSDLLREKIESGVLSFGESIPSERELSETYGLNRMTVRNAVNILVDEGLLSKVQGKGTFVKKPKIDSAMDTIQGFGRFLEEQGVKPSSKVIFSGTRPAGYKFHKIFGIEEDAPVFRLYRLRLGDGEPVSVEDTYVPYDMVRGIEKIDFQIYSLYSVFEQYGIRMHDGTEKLEIVRITNPEAKLLGLKPDSMAFRLENISRSAEGEIVEYTVSYTRGERFSYSSQTD